MRIYTRPRAVQADMSKPSLGITFMRKSMTHTHTHVSKNRSK